MWMQGCAGFSVDHQQSFLFKLKSWIFMAISWGGCHKAICILQTLLSCEVVGRKKE
jgi:hypothetical protein